MILTKKLILMLSIILFIYFLFNYQNMIRKEGYVSNHPINVIFCG